MKKYLGLDIGTNSIGWAVTDENYNLLEKKKSPMWGVHLFDDASNRDERRKYRTARRTTRRRKWRITILQELFNEEISKVDIDFFKRLKVQNEGLFTSGDKEYFKKYPTIHHVIKELIETNEKPDIRHVYLACSYYMKHRGHFYANVSADNSEKVLELKTIFDEFCDAVLEHLGIQLEFAQISSIEKALLNGVNEAKRILKTVLSAVNDDENILPLIITLLAGGTVDLGKLFSIDDLLDEKLKITEKDLEDAQDIAIALEDKFIVLETAKRVTDWVVLKNILGDKKSINEQRLALYKDIEKNKDLIIETYYSGMSSKDKKDINKEIDDKIKKGEITDKNRKREHKNLIFMRYIKKCHADNRVIPYQLQWADFRKVLENAKKFYPNLEILKIGKLFKHRIPYYVGPLRESEFGWASRLSDEKLYPWNFDDLIDKETTRDKFIRRMTAKCTYCAGADVLPKESLLYAKFSILNQLNCIKVDDNRIENDVKKRIFEALFLEENKTVSVKNIKAWLLRESLVLKSAQITGVDVTLQGTMKAHHKFEKYIKEGKLKNEEIEEIINRLTIFGSERFELKDWVANNFKKLNEDDIRNILRFSFNGYGRFSREFLEEIICDVGGISMSIIQAMWETNHNLMELLSDKFGFAQKLKEANQKIVNKKDVNSKDYINERLDGLYISNRVKRMIFRTLDVFEDICELQAGERPDKVFIEMARGDGEKKRTKSRKTQLKELLKGNQELLDELDDLGKDKEADEKLRSKKLYLYFAQMGYCVYTGRRILPSSLLSSDWDIDHIYPRSKVKDDSIHNNLVLVDKKYNGSIKGDIFPLPPEIQTKMRYLWEDLRRRNTKNESLMSAEKFARLTRTTEFTEDEKVNFVNRQLVETRQSTKALATILKEKYNVDVVYVKSGLVTEFRQDFEYYKCRDINDYHHAKDAYLNVVCGSVYDTVFTRDPRNYIKNAKTYSIKPKVLYNMSEKIKNNWQKDTHEIIRKNMASNKIKYTEFAYEQTGDLWGKTLGLAPRKGEYSNIEKKSYELSTRLFALVSYGTKKGREAKLLPIYNYRFEEFDRDADNYFKNIYPELNKGFKLQEVKLIRRVKLKSVIVKDGVRFRITGNTGMAHTYQLTLEPKLEEMFRKVCKAVEKSDCEKLKEENILELFLAFKNKLTQSVYSKISPICMQDKYFDVERFKKLTLPEQAKFLVNAVNLFTANKVLADLKLLDGAGTAGGMQPPSTADYIIDQSPTGFFERKFKVGDYL